MNTRPETYAPLIHSAIDDFVLNHTRLLSDVASVHRRHVNLMNVANVSVHASISKEDILAFNATQEYTRIWLILSTIRQNGDIVLDTLECCYV